jgi:hydroxymethylpyrimidine/phosphomethylpyrimidine kinase
MKRINALTIAGTDPSGGAGIQADLKTFSALGAYGCSVITALVAQNTRGVQSVYRIEPDFVAAQLDSVFSDVRIDTTKIGMLAETDIVEAVAERQALSGAKRGAGYRHAGKKRRSAALRLRRGDAAYKAAAAGGADHAQSAGSRRAAGAPHAQTEREMKEQGNALLAMGCGAVLMKGGHLMMRKARTGSLPATAKYALPRRACRPKTPTARAVRSPPRWRRCARA